MRKVNFARSPRILNEREMTSHIGQFHICTSNTLPRQWKLHRHLNRAAGCENPINGQILLLQK